MESYVPGKITPGKSGTCSRSLGSQILACLLAPLLATALVLIPFTAANAQNFSAAELRVALIFNFIRYIEWPQEQRFKTFNIAMYGEDENVYQELMGLVNNTEVRGRRFQLTRLRNSKFDPSLFQIVYVSADAAAAVPEIASKIRRTETLLITDNSEDLRDIMINIVQPDEQHLNFEINKGNILYEHLKVDKEILLLGGTELDVAELFRETESALKSVQESLRARESLLAQLESDLTRKKAQIQRQEKTSLEQESKLRDRNLELQEKFIQVEDYESRLNALTHEYDSAGDLLLDKQDALRRSQNNLDMNLAILEDRERKVETLTEIIQRNNAILERQDKDLSLKKVEIDEKSQTISEQRGWLMVFAVGMGVFSVLMLTILFVDRARKRSNQQLLQTHLQLKAAKVDADLARDEALAAKDEAEKLREIADQANRAKSMFLAKMSHEIRTPMSGVLGMSELLGDMELNQEQKRCNNVIHASGKALLTVINDILDYSKIEAGKMKLEAIPFEIENVVWEVLKMFRVQSQEKNLPLMSDICPTTPTRVVGDPVRIRQILINLISNAFKFTSHGQIMVLVAPDEQKNTIKFSVCDTGIGLNEEQQQSLFSAFTQADASTTRKYGGTGLGLAISKQLAEIMGGHIGVESNPGHGATFWVTINLPADLHAQPREAEVYTDLAGKRILLIDDNITYSALLKKYAARHNLYLLGHESPELALEHLRTVRKKGQAYDLILTDLNMPAQTGIQFAKRLLKIPAIADIPIVLMTASSTPPQAKEFAGTNIIMAVDKPLVESEFIELLNSAIMRRSVIEADDAITANHTDTFPALNILMAEDNAVIRKVMGGMLAKCQQGVDFAVNGNEAVAAVKAAKLPYDLVFMDCEMPEMDGLTATSLIRQWEHERGLDRTRIIALTAHVLKEQVERCRRSGMDDFMVKPINFNKLKDALIKAAAERDETGPQAARPPAIALPGVSPKPLATSKGPQKPSSNVH